MIHIKYMLEGQICQYTLVMPKGLTSCDWLHSHCRWPAGCRCGARCGWKAGSLCPRCTVHWSTGRIIMILTSQILEPAAATWRLEDLDYHIIYIQHEGIAFVQKLTGVVTTTTSWFNNSAKQGHRSTKSMMVNVRQLFWSAWKQDYLLLWMPNSRT